MCRRQPLPGHHQALREPAARVPVAVRSRAWLRPAGTSRHARALPGGRWRAQGWNFFCKTLQARNLYMGAASAGRGVHVGRVRAPGAVRRERGLPPQSAP
eukprot:8210784-Pyramimonas_sp.AAC.1